MAMHFLIASFAIISPSITKLDQSAVMSTLGQNKEEHEEECAVALSDLPPCTLEESDSTGLGTDSSQAIRTSDV